MKTQKFILVSFFLIFLSPILLIAQDISVHTFIGKTKSDVIKKYGNPVHQDNNNPAMICLFYQTKSKRMIFVSNQNGVFQSEATATYDTEKKARSEVDDCIAGSVADGFVVDTVSINDFQLHRSGIMADLQLNKNNITKKFEIRIKARRSID